MMSSMKTILAGAAVAVLAAGIASSASAQSAKFTAAWEDGVLGLAEFVKNMDPVTGEETTGATEIMSTIKVPNKKELLIGVSGVANIVTFTEAKGRNGGFKSVAVAEGTMGLEVRVVPTGEDANCGLAVPAGGMIAAPGELTFASRKQELTVTVDLDILDIEGTCGGDLQPPCVADTLEIVGDVTVALGLDTTAAHHFNFVAPDLGVGTYDVVACFDALADGLVTEEEIGDNKVRAYVAIKNRMITVQEVRAVQGDFVDLSQ